MSKPANKQLPAAVSAAIRQCFDKINNTKRHSTLAYSANDPAIKMRHDLDQVHSLLSLELSIRSLQQVLYSELGLEE